MHRNKQHYIWGLEAIGFFILACGFYLIAKSAIGMNQIMGFIFTVAMVCLGISYMWRFFRAHRNL